MIYATSDLHGYPLERFKMLLRKAHFSDRDYLFVLGDVIDRNGDGGVEMLRWMMVQPNVELILGNHEAMLLACAFLFDEITMASIDGLNEERLGSLSNWLYNGAQPTLDALRALREEDADALTDIIRRSTGWRSRAGCSPATRSTPGPIERRPPSGIAAAPSTTTP